MGRKSLCYILDGWVVTEIGGKGVHKLCKVEEGMARFRQELKKWQKECREERKRQAEKTAEN
jgi:hypothetical protein